MSRILAVDEYIAYPSDIEKVLFRGATVIVPVRAEKDIESPEKLSDKEYAECVMSDEKDDILFLDGEPWDGEFTTRNAAELVYKEVFEGNKSVNRDEMVQIVRDNYFPARPRYAKFQDTDVREDYGFSVRWEEFFKAEEKAAEKVVDEFMAAHPRYCFWHVDSYFDIFAVIPDAIILSVKKSFDAIPYLQIGVE